MIKSIYLILIGLFAGYFLHAQETSHWRGQFRNGIYQDKGLLKSWPSGGPQILWTAVGLGHKSEKAKAATVVNNVPVVKTKRGKAKK